MKHDNLVLAVDQGSGSTKAVLVSVGGVVVASAAVPIASSYPRPGWVEQSPQEIVDSVRTVVGQVMRGRDPVSVVGVGISTQRESLVLWERSTGLAVGPLVSWQDQRNAQLCRETAQAGHADLVESRSGLPLDPMFSATKATWLLDAYDPDRSGSRSGRLCLGTVDSWLLSQFGDDHLIEIGNASRTQLMNIHSGRWDEDLLEIFNVPVQVLGDIVTSTGPFPTAKGLDPLSAGTPIAAVMGDSHAALFAHAGWTPGAVKATYGTGSSVMGLCPPGRTAVGAGLCLTVAWDDGTGPSLAAEGNIRSSGATLTWLSRLFAQSPGSLAQLAESASSDGVHIVPAFNGLGAPYWDREASGLIAGLSLGTELPQLARATLESIVFQVEDVVAAIDSAEFPVTTLLADGGASGNKFLMQLQADISGRVVARSAETDLSSLGAAHLAGRHLGLWSTDELLRLPRDRQTFVPALEAADRHHRRQGWADAVLRSRRLS